VKIDRPSALIAMPVSSVGPKVICSSLPLAKVWRHTWLEPFTVAVKYIARPSGDQPADVHPPSGPISEPVDVPSNGTRRQRPQSPVGPIWTTRIHRLSGEAWP
jgi:hypothetical protein